MEMIAYKKISTTAGISKKIICEAEALSKITGACNLYCLDESLNPQKIMYINNNYIGSEQIDVSRGTSRIAKIASFTRSVNQDILKHKTSCLYIRHMIPTFSLITLLRKVKKRNDCAVYYEIPTYPYFYEQLSLSKRKPLTLARVIYECLFWPWIYHYVTLLVAICCRSGVHKFRKMVFITNGYNNSSLISNSVESRQIEEDLTLVGVGNITRYHGYEKIIQAISRYDGRMRIRFLIVGDGDIGYLKELTSKLSLEDNVKFLGPLSGIELENVYRQGDVGVGTLGLELRKADIDTGIKILDYYVRGLPVISSGICPGISEINPALQPSLHINDEIDFQRIIEFSKSYGPKERNRLAMIAKDRYSWYTILKRIILS